jgi:hypothetical protein
MQHERRPSPNALSYREARIRTPLRILGTFGVSILTSKTLTGCEVAPSPKLRLAQIEQRIGDRPLTLEEATEVLDATADLYISSGFTTYTKKELAEATLILPIEPDPNIDRDLAILKSGTVPTDSLTLNQVYKDHPEVKEYQQYLSTLYSRYPFLQQYATDVMAEMILSSRKSDLFGSNFFYSKYVLINLPKINLPSDTVATKQSDEGQTCSPATPFKKLVEVLIHEWVHNESNKNRGISITNEVKVEAEVFEVLKKIYKNRHAVDLTEARGLGLSIFSYNRNGYFPVSGFEELSAVYLTHKILDGKQIPFVPGYQKSINIIDLQNVDRVLIQANISVEEFNQLHRDSQVGILLLKLSKSAKNTTDKTNDEVIENLFEAIFRWGTQIDWEKIKIYFPEVESNGMINKDITDENKLQNVVIPLCILTP